MGHAESHVATNLSADKHTDLQPYWMPFKAGNLRSRPLTSTAMWRGFGASAPVMELRLPICTRLSGRRR